MTGRWGVCPGLSVITGCNECGTTSGFEGIFRPFDDDLYNLSDIGAFTRCGAQAQFALPQTVTGALFGSRGTGFKNGPVIKIFESTRRNCKGVAAIVVKQKKPQCQVVKIDLIADYLSGGVCEKIFARGPYETTDGTFFKRHGLQF